MTRDEFYDWRKDHFAAFTGLVAWHKHLEDGTATMRHWYSTLSDCDLEDARRATRHLHSQQDRDLYFSDHPAAVLRLCENYVRRRTPTPSTTYKLRECTTPDLHRDYAEQLDDWLALTDDERHRQASEMYGLSFQLDRTLRPMQCGVCDRKHGDGMFLMVLFDATAGTPQPAAEGN